MQPEAFRLLTEAPCLSAENRLEAIVTMLEKGDATLGDSMALFEEGTKLVNQCRKELDSAEQKVVKLSKGADGAPVESDFFAEE